MTTEKAVVAHLYTSRSSLSLAFLRDLAKDIPGLDKGVPTGLPKTKACEFYRDMAQRHALRYPVTIR